MDHSYTKTIWEDAPSMETPLSAYNLNNMENGIAAIYYEVGLLEQLITAGRSYVGMVVMSTTLDTMAKVIEIYGGEQWARIDSTEDATMTSSKTVYIWERTE